MFRIRKPDRRKNRVRDDTECTWGAVLPSAVRRAESPPTPPLASSCSFLRQRVCWARCTALWSPGEDPAPDVPEAAQAPLALKQEPLCLSLCHRLYTGGSAPALQAASPIRAGFCKFIWQVCTGLPWQRMLTAQPASTLSSFLLLLGRAMCPA